MKKWMKFAAVAALAGMLAGCAGSANVCGTTYQPYGLFNKEDVANPNVHYSVSIGSIVVAAVFVETIIVPVYVLGWDLFYPDSPKSKVIGTTGTCS